MKKTNFMAVLCAAGIGLGTTIFTGTLNAADDQNAPQAPKIVLPGEGGTKAAVTYDYFPDRLHTFIFRNWTLVPQKRLAEVLETTPEKVASVAASMGLEPQGTILPAWGTPRGYITVLRRNWHLLPYDQLLTLLDIDREELRFRLQEDDFLWVKLGWVKPACEKLVYTEPTPETTARAKQIAELLKAELADEKSLPEEERFTFIDRLKDPSPDIVIPEKSENEGGFELRYIASYFATFGEPLLDPEIESCPEGLLQRLAAAGVNGVWFHTVLRTLVPPTEDFPEFGKDHERRIAGLNKLVQRAKKYGIGIYLYSNEPRSMPTEFFAKEGRESMKGVTEGQFSTMCTSDPRVQKWLSDSYEYVFKNVPDLAGVFTITASENLTSCASHWHQGNCPRCSKRTTPDIIAEVNTLIEQGVHRGNPNAKMIVWDWGWQDQFAEEIIQKLPKSCWLQSVSEWNLPINRGGVASAVGEYSLSAVGPGPRAQKHWKYAQDAGLKTSAKVQVNLSWEFSAIPHLPVLDLVAQHANNLSKQHVNGLMLSWSLGGYPSENLSLFQTGSTQDITPEENLKNVAVSYYGEKAAPEVLKAWKAFSDGFAQYPYHGNTLYHGPQHSGPANPLYLKPTGYPATMVGIPYDDLKAWRSVYPPEVWILQMALVRNGFTDGCAQFEKAIALMPEEKQQFARTELGQYRAAELHFASCVNQARFTYARDELLALDKAEDAEDKAERRKALIISMKRAAQAELQTAKDFYPYVKADSSIGYESSNHYFYIPEDIEEKIINCKYILDQLDKM